MPSVSVIIPTHNRSSLVQRATQSVLEQSYTDFELIVVDDGSTDDTEYVVTDIDDGRLRYVRHDVSCGASSARNTGIERSKGEYIAFLDDDDRWHPDKLQRQVSLFDNLSDEHALVYTWYEVVGETSTKTVRPILSGYIFPQMLPVQPIGNTSTLMVRRSVCTSVGGFDEDLPRGNDGDFIRRIARRYLVDVVPGVLVSVHTNHNHQRITRNDPTGIANAITGQQAKLRKFDGELQSLPRQRALIEAKIAHRWSQVGRYGEMVDYHLRSMRSAPCSPQVYLYMMRSIRSILQGRQ